MQRLQHCSKRFQILACHIFTGTWPPWSERGFHSWSFCVHSNSHIAGHHEELTLNKQTYLKSKICPTPELFSVFIRVSVKSNSAFEIFTVKEAPLVRAGGIMVVRMGLKELGVSEVHHLGPSKTLH